MAAPQAKRALAMADKPLEIVNTDSKRRKQTQAFEPPYTGMEVPKVSVYHPSFLEAEGLITFYCDKILYEIADLRTRGFQDDNIDRVAQSLRTLRCPGNDYPSPKRIGFVGDTAAGKSSLIDCLLNERGLASESDDGHSGTCVVQEFVKAPANQKEKYVATVYFHDNRKIEKLVRQHLGDIRLDATNNDEEDLSDGDLDELGSRHDTAVDFFLAVLSHGDSFKGEEDIVAFIKNAKSQSGETGVQDVLRRILVLLDKFRQKSGSSQLTFAGNDMSLITMKLNSLRRPNPQADSSPASPWPLISRAQIQMSTLLLNVSVMLADLPGLTDSNQIRVEATKAYLKSCSCVVIVHPIARIVDSETVMSSLRECARRAKSNVIIVATKVDEMKFRTQFNDWPQEDQHEIQDLITARRRLEEQLRRQLEDGHDEGDRRQGSVATEVDLAKVRATGHKLQLRRRNRNVAIELQIKSKKAAMKQDPGARTMVVCVSNTQYQMHLTGFDLRYSPDLTVRNTGIPVLRDALFKLPAAGKMAALEIICCEQLPLALNRLMLACSKSLLQQKREIVLEIQEWRKTCSIAVDSTMQQLTLVPKEFIKVFLSHDLQWTSEAKVLITKWTKMHATVFKTHCRHRGGSLPAKRKTSMRRPQASWNVELGTSMKTLYSSRCRKSRRESMG